MFLGMGPMELIVIAGVVLLIFGPKNLPKLGKTLGTTVKSIREGMDEVDDTPSTSSKKHIEDAEVVDTKSDDK